MLLSSIHLLLLAGTAFHVAQSTPTALDLRREIAGDNLFGDRALIKRAEHEYPAFYDCANAGSSLFQLTTTTYATILVTPILALLHELESRPSHYFKAWWVERGLPTTNNRLVRTTLEIIGVTTEAVLLNAIAGFWANNLFIHIICPEVAVYVPLAGRQKRSIEPGHELNPIAKLKRSSDRNATSAFRYAVVEDRAPKQKTDGVWQIQYSQTKFSF